MNALVYTDVQTLSYQPEAQPEPLPGEVLVRVQAAGICGSDMHAFLGHDARRQAPLILGHEVAGVVVSGEYKGQSVIVNPLISCHQCNYCLLGRANLCPHRTMVGMSRAGGFADYLVVPKQNLIATGNIDPVHATLAEPAATVLHALHLVQRTTWRPLAESKVLIIGGGAIGMLSYLFLHAFGVVDVTLSETNALRRTNYRDKVDLKIIDPLNDDPGSAQYDLVLDVVGLGLTRQAAVDAVRPGGVVMHIGLGEDEGIVNARKLTLSEITFIGTYAYTTVDMRKSLEYLQAGKLGGLSWIQTRPLSEGQEAFAALLAQEIPSPKIILVPDVL